MGRARTIVAEAPSPDAALDGLVRAHIDFALSETALITVYDQEAHNLDDAGRRRLRRQQRAYTELWIDVLDELAPGRKRDALATAVHGVFGLLNSVADHRRQLDDDEVALLLYAMARRCLDVASSGPAS
jgi:hypothetical protein